jgi:hypothetical protein
MAARARRKSVDCYRVLGIALTGGGSLSGHQIPEERFLDREVHKTNSDAGTVWSKRKGTIEGRRTVSVARIHSMGDVRK